MFAYGKPSQVTKTTNICCSDWSVKYFSKGWKKAEIKRNTMNENLKMHVNSAEMSFEVQKSYFFCVYTFMLFFAYRHQPSS